MAMRSKLRAFRLWLFRKDCSGGHAPNHARFRERHSRYSVALTVCKRCGAVLEAEGRREH